MAVTGSDKVAKEIVDALGIKNCRFLNIRLRYDEVAVVTAEFYPDTEQLEKLVPILKEYELVEKKKEIAEDKEEE